MGVPALFRWLSAKYPKIITPVIEEQTGADGGSINLSEMNPNGIEFDNLYLDMNGIIHPCCHPEGKEAPETEEKMMEEIFKYIDRIFGMIRPRKLLYLAIDGVAPRAKMNQQRSRRFRAAQEAREKQERATELRQEMAQNGTLDEQEDDSASNFDSNCITPGTPFMDLVARSLRYYIHDRVNNHPAWQQINIILSDASVPGEGEHKIVDYIRKQRLEPNYDPNQQNVIYGLDADLIMLSMATHESRFHVLREDVFAEDKNKNSNCYSCGKPGHIADKCPGKFPVAKNLQSPEHEIILSAPAPPKPFIFLQVTILREYLEAELKPQRPVSFEFNVERAIDDWIFLCFFVGNDFLPHLPSLELREGAIDILLKIYKDLQGQLNGYICDGGKVNLERAQMIMIALAKVEPTIFEKRQLKEERRLENINRRKAAEREEEARYSEDISRSEKKRNADSEQPDPKKPHLAAPVIEIVTPQSSGQSNRDIIEQQRLMREKNIEAARALKSSLQAEPIAPDNVSTTSLALSGISEDSEAPVDIVKLWEPGARERYYVSKFNIRSDEVDEFAKKVARSYVEGFCWVLAYYYRGCPSWKWFYPYHYAPFAADLVDIADLEIEFEQGEPFRPFDQLMAVFPAASREHIPPAFHHLMTSHNSEIIDFYPEDFLIDMNGKKAAWQGVALLPFIEEKRLLEALEASYPNLTESERKRNFRGNDMIYTFKETRLGKWIELNVKEAKLVETTVPPCAQLSLPDENSYVPIGKTFFSHIESLPDIKNDQLVSAKLILHTHSLDDYNFNLLPGVVPPERQLTESDIYMTRTGSSAQSFPNILSYGNYGGGNRNHHSMHRDTREQMQRADGARSGNIYGSANRNSYESGYNRDSRDYSRDNRNYSRDNRASNDYSRDRERNNSRDNRSYGYSRSENNGESVQDDRYSEYGSANVPGPYDIPNNNSGYSNSNRNGRQYNNRYNRR